MYVGHPGFMLQTDIKNKKKIFTFWIKLFQAKHIPLIWAVNTFIGCLFWLYMDAVSCLLQQQNESLFYLQVQKLFVRSNVFSKVWTTKTDPYVEICSYSIDKTLRYRQSFICLMVFRNYWSAKNEWCDSIMKQSRGITKSAVPSLWSVNLYFLTLKTLQSVVLMLMM